MSKPKIAVIGGGLAGVEVVWQLARAELPVTLFEMKPEKFSPAHKNPNLAELVCSNSFRSNDLRSAVGLLKEEMLRANSLIMSAALETKVPAGKALAVDRDLFAKYVTETLEESLTVEIKRREINSLSDPLLSNYSKVIIAAGPLASEPLTKSLAVKIGDGCLCFYDAIAPIVSAEGINWDKVFWGSRYDMDKKDYLNCPLTEEEYHRLRDALLTGKQVAYKPFEAQTHFEGCLPIETLAERGEMTLAFGPLKPVGLKDPKTGKQPFAVVQLRPENKDRTMFNMVGFQTKLTFDEQKRIFRMIPGLEIARFERLGSMHRNTFINSPKVLSSSLELEPGSGLYLAGQITGVEGYVESAACGLWIGLYLANLKKGKKIGFPPPETAIGGLMRHLRTSNKNFQPMNVNFGLMPPLSKKIKKAEKKDLYVQRAREAWTSWWEQLSS